MFGRAVADEKKRPGSDLPPDRQGQLIKILMDHLSPQDSPLAFLRRTVEKGGRPPKIDAFNRKLMLAGGEIQKAVHCVEVCGFSLVPKGSKRSSEQDFRRTSKKPKSSPVSDHSRHPPLVSKQGPPVCNGCGKPHKGDCLFKTHPDYNHTALPWQDSDMGKAYLAKGFTSLSKNPPYINGTEWVNKPDELTTKDSSKSSRSQYGNRGEVRS